MPRTSSTSSDGQRERRQGGGSADQTNIQQLSYLAATSRSTSPYLSPYAPVPPSQPQRPSVPVLPSQRGASPASSIHSGSASIARSYTRSVHSSSSRDDVTYDLLGPRDYTFDMPMPNRALSHVSHPPDTFIVLHLRHSAFNINGSDYVSSNPQSLPTCAPLTNTLPSAG